MIAASGVAELRHDLTGETFNVNAAALHWEEEGVDERGMGTESVTWAVAEYVTASGEKVSCKFLAYEYPAGVLNYLDYEATNATLVKNFGYAVAIDTDEWGDQD